MKLKLAQEDNSGVTTISEKEIANILAKKEKSYFYFDEKNKHKDILKLKEYLENINYSVYLREAPFNIEKNYVYELHAV